MKDYREYYRRHLPHWQPEGATLFVTIRLAGSLPREVVDALKAEQEAEKKGLAVLKSQEDYREQAYIAERRYYGRWDSALDQSCTGPHWLRIPEITSLVAKALHYRDGKVYDLIAFCIMSNHLHSIFTPFQKDNGIYFPLHRIMQSLKRYTARHANQILQREGSFWQAESYDHVVRDMPELQRIIQYTLNNPVKAGLTTSWLDWPGNYCKADYQSILQE